MAERSEFPVGQHKADGSGFSKSVNAEWELILPLMVEDLGQFWMVDVVRADGMPHSRTIKTRERALAIAKEIFLGMPAKWAALYCGCGESTFFEWAAASPAFAELVKRARAARMRSLVKIIRDEAPTTWIAAMTMLERLENEDFGRTAKVRHSHEGTVGIDVRPMLASPESIAHIAALEASYADQEFNSRDTPAHGGLLPEHED